MAVLKLCVCMVPGQSSAAVMAESGARVTLHSPRPPMTSASLATWRAVTEPELGPRRAPETVGKMSNPPIKGQGEPEVRNSGHSEQIVFPEADVLGSTPCGFA